MTETFGDRLKRVRTARGVSQQQLAERLGVSNVALCKWEKGYCNPLLSKIAAIASALDTSTDFLLLGTPAKRQQPFRIGAGTPMETRHVP